MNIVLAAFALVSADPIVEECVKPCTYSYIANMPVCVEDVGGKLVTFSGVCELDYYNCVHKTGNEKIIYIGSIGVTL